uniref:Uncharacterized protein n=1 Tax=Oryza meridionalis TaxID=40149 RepID=A0A0E0C2Y7_9ORYZ
MSLSEHNARTHHVVIDMEEMREEDPDHHNHEPADGIAGNRQSLHIRVPLLGGLLLLLIYHPHHVIPRKPVQGVLLLCLGGALGVIWRMQGTRLLQGWLDRLAIVGEQWLGGVQQDSRLQMVDRGLELMLIGLWCCAQRRHPSHDAELKLLRDMGGHLRSKKMQHLQNLIRSTQAHVIFVSETKISVISSDDLTNAFPVDHSFVVPADRNSGGLWLMWTNEMDLTVAMSSANYVLAFGVHNLTKAQFVSLCSQLPFSFSVHMFFKLLFWCVF